MLNCQSCQHQGICAKGAPGHQLCDTRELNKLREDYCYLDRRNYDAKKPLKFVTYQYRPYHNLTPQGGVTAPCVEGYLYNDGAVGACTVQDESNLKIDNTVLTRGRYRQQLTNLRPNLPHVRGCLRPNLESELIYSLYQDNSKTCTPTEVYLPHQWQFFNHLGYNPNDPNFTVQKEHGLRGGISTRNSLRENYVSGKTCYKNINNWKL